MKYLTLKRKAFSLVEVIIFISLFSIMIALLSHITRQYHRDLRILNIQSDTFEEFQFGMTLIKDEIRQADYIIKDFKFKSDGMDGELVPILIYNYNDCPKDRQTHHGYTLFRINRGTIYRMKFYTKHTPKDYANGMLVTMGSYGLSDTGNTPIIQGVDYLSSHWEEKDLISIECKMENGSIPYKTWLHTRNLYNQ